MNNIKSLSIIFLSLSVLYGCGDESGSEEVNLIAEQVWDQYTKDYNLKLTNKDDPVTITNIRGDRGNCPFDQEEQAEGWSRQENLVPVFPVTLKFGKSETFEFSECDELVEAEVVTKNHGTMVYSW